MIASVTDTAPFITDDDLRLMADGAHIRAYEKLGAHVIQREGRTGTHFAVWAPNARKVSVVGEFNQWDTKTHPMALRGLSGLWECFIPDVGPGTLYKYAIASRFHNYRVQKADPYAFTAETRPKTASRVWDLSGFQWNDGDWMARRAAAHGMDAPMSIYEVHLGSWMRLHDEGKSGINYREIAPKLADYCRRVGYTHVEFLPLSEHPFDGSWGYQTVGYFATSSRFGTPQDFMALVDTLHQQGVGVILDWVPAHFARDEHGLAYFDGTHLYEHADPRKGSHKDWGTLIFNYSRHEVANFLVSNALFWLDKYHIDGLRVDAVASMLYLDYSRKPGEWVPNEHGGRENLEAITFLRRVNETVNAQYPGAMTIAEESTAWPLVSRPAYLGGLGFTYKWDMGWMHDTLAYFSQDPILRKFHHNRLTFRTIYAYSENFILSLSHDEVVHGKGSLLAKMPGDRAQKFANLRLLYGFMGAEPGKKLLFMGAEFGQEREWNHDLSLDWALTEDPQHRGLQRWVGDLNRCYRGNPALHALDCDPAGFEWVDCSDAEQNVISFLRKGRHEHEQVLVVCNFSAAARTHYRIGVSCGGWWKELLNSDGGDYGGGNLGNGGGMNADPVSQHGRPYSLDLTLPPLSVLFFQRP